MHCPHASRLTAGNAMCDCAEYNVRRTPPARPCRTVAAELRWRSFPANGVCRRCLAGTAEYPPAAGLPSLGAHPCGRIQTKSKMTGEKVEIPPAVRKDMSDLFAQIDEDNGGTVRALWAVTVKTAGQAQSRNGAFDTRRYAK